MKPKLLFVTDLGLFKAFRIINDENSSHPRVQLFETITPEDSHGRMMPLQGRFPGGTHGATTPSYGEQHNATLEFERRTVEFLANRIAEICAKQPESPMIYLAAHKEINHQIIERLGRWKQFVHKTLLEDLTKVPETTLMSHFKHGEPAHA
jgi:hypothetical protein